MNNKLMDKQSDSENLNAWKIFKFWIPLSITWLMMATEGPLVAAVIARLAFPTYNLAAYGVAFAIALLVEAPVVMIISASTALVKDRCSYVKLRNFIFLLILLVTFIQLVVVIPPVFNFIAHRIIKLDPRISSLAHLATLIMLPWPGSIGYRRFYQGILIGHQQTRKVALGTIIRLISMSATALILYKFTNLKGAYVGTAALSAGVSLEAAATRFMSREILSKLKHKFVATADFSYSFLIKFYYPLALTSYLILGIHPLVTYFLSQGRLSIESLAIFPVLNSLVFIFRSFGFSYQEVGIALLGNDYKNYQPLKSFAFKLGLSTTVALALVAFTPLSMLWFHYVSGLSDILANLAILPLSVLILMPALTTLLSWQRSFLVKAGCTYPITIATGLEVFILMLVLYVGINLWGMVGINAAAFALLLGRISANIYLFIPYYRIKKRKDIISDKFAKLPSIMNWSRRLYHGRVTPLKTKGP